MTVLERGRIVVFLAVMLASPACAGQLKEELYGLADIARNGGFAALVTVLTVGPKNRLTCLVTRLWTRPGARPVVLFQERRTGSGQDGHDRGAPYSYQWSEELVKGCTKELAVYQGVVWDNPDKSPIDCRVRDYLDVLDIKAGARVIAVFPRVELILADAANLRKLDLFFGSGDVLVNGQSVLAPGAAPVRRSCLRPPRPADAAASPREAGTVVYGKRESIARLVDDLGDFDLSDMAYEALKARGALTANALLTAAASGRLSGARNLLCDHFTKLDNKQQDLLVREAVAAVRSGRDDGRRAVLAEFLDNRTLANRFAAERAEVAALGKAPASR